MLSTSTTVVAIIIVVTIVIISIITCGTFGYDIVVGRRWYANGSGVRQDDDEQHHRGCEQ